MRRGFAYLPGDCVFVRIPPEVFLGGPAPLARSVGKVCDRLGLGSRYERF